MTKVNLPINKEILHEYENQRIIQKRRRRKTEIERKEERHEHRQKKINDTETDKQVESEMRRKSLTKKITANGLKDQVKELTL